MKLTNEMIWEDMVALYRSHSQAILAIAGVFLFLPALAFNMFVDMPPMASTSAEQLVIGVNNWFRDNWLALLLQTIVTSFGGLALYRCLLPNQPTTAQAAITQALPLLPLVLITNVLANFALGVGFYLLIVPGLYLAGRLLITIPSIAVGQARTPFGAMKRSFELTRSRGWQLIGMFVLLLILIFISTTIVQMIIGVFAKLILPEAGVALFGHLMSATFSTLMSLAGILMAAAAYRQLSASI